MGHSTDRERLEAARAGAVPSPLREALGETPAYLVGGAVRDALLGRPLGDVDVAVDAELEPILMRLGVEARSHERFATASLELDGRGVDLARTRRERYPFPGSLPQVSPAPIRADLARRDFTVNALALPLAGELELIDPYDGRADLDSGLLRAIAPDSFRDDPTRALRAARYAARLDLALEPETERELREADLGTVSADRVAADLSRIATEPEAVTAFDLLASWGLLQLDRDRLELLGRAAALAADPPWANAVERSELLLRLASADEEWLGTARELARAPAEELRPSQLSELARAHDDLQLAAARALGARWLDRYLLEWRPLQLEIRGQDLLAAGVSEGPELGQALRATRDALLDDRIEPGREPELRAALEAIGRTPPS